MVKGKHLSHVTARPAVLTDMQETCRLLDELTKEVGLCSIEAGHRRDDNLHLKNLSELSQTPSDTEFAP